MKVSRGKQVNISKKYRKIKSITNNTREKTSI